MKQPAVARSRRASPVLVCKKCLKRNSEGGRLRRELEREIKRRGNGVQKAPPSRANELLWTVSEERGSPC
jgi:hypothetical protein